MGKQTLSIDVISDVMCPWCYIGKANLDAAIEQAPELDVQVHWYPYQLDSTLPKMGIPRDQYLNNKFGGEEKAREIYGNIKQAGKDVGIDFNFDAIKVSPNTLDAHRLILWAGGQSIDQQNNVVTRLFEVFFLEGGHIGLDEVLIKVAKHAGMDGMVVKQLLEGDDDKSRITAEVQSSQQAGITGVPCFLIANKIALMGAQPPDQLAKAMRQAAAEANDEAQYDASSDT